MTTTQRPYWIGLTGGIGSGKSTVAQLLADQGIKVVDADAISRVSTGVGGVAIEAIRAQFGSSFITPEGALDRAQMRQLVFSDPSARQRLEQIIHPLVQQQMRQQAEAATSPYVVWDIPLLIESIDTYRPQFQRICVVDCDEPTQVLRVQARSQLDAEQVHEIIASQASREQRLHYADDVIYNGGEYDLEALRQQVMAKHAEWLALSRANR